MHRPHPIACYHLLDAAEGLDLVHGEARQMPMAYALSNGFGFGGVNASVLFRRWA